MSLQTICTNALYAIGGFDVPSSFYGSSNPTSRMIVAVANEEGCDLERGDRWQELITEYTFDTVDGTSSYDLPSGFRAFAHMTQWDRTNTWRLTGPVPSMVWQWLKSGITVASSATSWFAIRGNQFVVYPTPSDVRTIAFDYYSKLWIVKSSDSTYSSSWTSDNDEPRLDSGLITAGVKWRFLQAQGMPFETEYKRWESIKESLLSDNGARAVIDLNSPCPPFPGGNIPETWPDLAP